MTFRTASLCLTVGLAAAIQGATPAPAAAQDKQPYVIYLSNNFVGNDWRQQMQRVAEVSVNKGPLEGRVDLRIEVAEGTVQAQINSLNNIIRQQPDAILIDAASDSALNPTIKRACDAGIVVISFDQVVTEPCAYALGSDWDMIPTVMAEWMVDQLGGKGNVIVDRGLAGAPISAQLQEGYEKVLAEHPDIKVVGYYNGDYALGPEQSGVAALLAANPQVDGVLTQGYGSGAIQALQGRRPADGAGGGLLLQRRGADLRRDRGRLLHPRLEPGLPVFGGDQARGRDPRHRRAAGGAVGRGQGRLRHHRPLHLEALSRRQDAGDQGRRERLPRPAAGPDAADHAGLGRDHRGRSGGQLLSARDTGSPRGAAAGRDAGPT